MNEITQIERLAVRQRLEDYPEHIQAYIQDALLAIQLANSMMDNYDYDANR